MRYALYFTPPKDHPLTSLAARWLGRDAFSDEIFSDKAIGPVPEGHAELTADPRRYGFHATLKAPFELAGSVTERDLFEVAAEFASRTKAFTIPELVLGQVPAGTHVLVMTHDHAEDAALCDAALRCGHLGTVGLIGSSAKWRRFAKRLAAEGHSAQDLERIHTPIGIPSLDAILVPEDDPYVNPIGVKGVGEIGVTGTVGAIANAVWHATGRRVRQFPIRIEHILSSL